MVNFLFLFFLVWMRRLAAGMGVRVRSMPTVSFCYMAININMLNVPGMFIIYIHNVEHIKNIGISKFEHVTISCSGTKPFY